MSEDRLPGWNSGAIFFASLVTGMAAALTAYALIILDNPMFLPSTLQQVVLSIAIIAMLGLAVGLLVVMPIAMIFSTIGIRLALHRQWMAYRQTWAGTGAAVGTITLLIPFLMSTNDGSPPSSIALFGAACGMTAALLCHRFLGIRRTV